MTYFRRPAMSPILGRCFRTLVVRSLLFLLLLLPSLAAVAQTRWEPVHGFLAATAPHVGVASIEFNAQNPRTVWFGATKDRLYVSHDGGRSARFVRQFTLGPRDRQGQPVGTVTALFVHPRDTLFMLAGSTFGAYLTRDGGGTWTRALPDTAVTLNGLSIAVEPGQPDVLYVGLFDNRNRKGVNFFRSTDRGRTWTARSIPMGEDGAGFCSMAAAGGGVLLAGANTRGGILRSEDYGETWTTVHTVTGRGDLWDVPRATFAPGNPNVAWGAIFGFVEPGYLVRSADGGRTWQQAASIIGVNPWAIEVDAQGRVFVGAWGEGAPGAYVSEDGGASWRVLPLPVRDPQQYAITWMVRNGPAGLFIGDEQYGAFRLDGFGTAAPASPPAPAGLTLGPVFPNPARGSAAVTVHAAKPGPVTVAAYDALGRRVALLHNGPLAGAATLSLRTDGLAPGAYVLVARGTAGQAVIRFTVVR
jgi:photosystem II stability/assembly factor-like uncharacterized protein